MRKLNSVFANLAISYITIVVVIVLLLCSIFYMYLPRNYNEEIRNKNQILLKNAAGTIETSFVERANKIYLDLTLEKTTKINMNTGPLQGQSSAIMDIQKTLKQEVINYSDTVQAIHLYYPKSKIMISSLYGLRYEADSHDEAFESMDWINQMLRNPTSYLWTEPRWVPKDIYSSASDNNALQPLITYVHSYPFHSTGKESDLIIGIDMKESALSRLIEQLMPSDYSNTYIINQLGIIISAADKSLLGTKAEQAATMDKLLSSDLASQSFNEKVNHTSYVVTGHRLQSNNWMIYNRIQENNFYKKSIFLQQVILFICVITILIGMILSGIFTFISYRPIKRIMVKIKGLFDHPAETSRNEYRLIDTAIHKLTSKVSSLEDTLAANKPVIKHNVVLNMLHNHYRPEELEEQLLSLNLSINFSNYCCMIIDPLSREFKELDSKMNQFVIYKLINQLESIILKDTQLIVEELPDQKMVVLVCTDLEGDFLLQELCSLVLSQVKTEFGLDFRIALGIWVQECIHVHKSFSAAQILIKYGYFFPEIPIIQQFRLLNREHSDKEMPQVLLQRFKEKLQSRNFDEVRTAINHLLSEMKEGMYSADHCRFIAMNLISMYSDFLKNIKFKQSAQFKIDLYKQYNDHYHINSFGEWLVQSIAECYRLMDKRGDDRAVESIETVKAYIGSHLSGDLSLEAVASQVYLSPKYLSKIFKEETGIGYTDYITQKRMEQAIELMANNGLTVEQIATAVGYGTTAYFIKKFKEINGCTPKAYVRSMLKQAEL